MDKQYWLLLHTSMTDMNLSGFKKRAHGAILEMYMNGETNMWPMTPHAQSPEFNELCEVCMRFLSPSAAPGTDVFRAGCLEGRGASRPCSFEPAPEAELHEDFEDLMQDGCPYDEYGVYRCPTDFLLAHDISPDTFIVIPLGIHPSIRLCRQWLRDNESLY